MDEIELEILKDAFMCDLDGGYGTNTKYISNKFKLSRYKTLKYLNNLKDKGYLIFKRGYEQPSCDYWGEWEHGGFFYSGWYITDKFVEDYKNICDNEYKKWKESWSIYE